MVGRYVESDPIGLKGGSYSPYVYVGNQPLRYVDRFGLRNGCGSEGTTFKPPDFPLGYAFFDCCNRHDDCYDDCRNNPSKDQCDGAFLNCMLSACAGGTGLQTHACHVLADIYYEAVHLGGNGAFQSARRACKAHGCPAAPGPGFNGKY